MTGARHIVRERDDGSAECLRGGEVLGLHSEASFCTIFITSYLEMQYFFPYTAWNLYDTAHSRGETLLSAADPAKMSSE